MIIENKEFVKRSIKCLLLWSIVTMSCVNIINTNSKDAHIIGTISMCVYILLDIFSPSICVKNDKN